MAGFCVEYLCIHHVYLGEYKLLWDDQVEYRHVDSKTEAVRRYSRTAEQLADAASSEQKSVSRTADDAADGLADRKSYAAIDAIEHCPTSFLYTLK